jgi:hypothetical protein
MRLPSWVKKGLTAAERFNYLYGESELREFLTSLEGFAARAARVHVLFNNCYRDFAQTRLLQSCLGHKEKPYENQWAVLESG